MLFWTNWTFLIPPHPPHRQWSRYPNTLLTQKPEPNSSKQNVNTGKQKKKTKTKTKAIAKMRTYRPAWRPLACVKEKKNTSAQKENPCNILELVQVPKCSRNGSLVSINVSHRRTLIGLFIITLWFCRGKEMAGYYLASLAGFPVKRAMPSTRVNVLRLFNSFF